MIEKQMNMPILILHWNIHLFCEAEYNQITYQVFLPVVQQVWNNKAICYKI